MKYDHASFAQAAPYAPSRAEVEDRVRRFLPLVRRTAWHINGRGREGLEIEDLVQAGILALTEGAERPACAAGGGVRPQAAKR